MVARINIRRGYWGIKRIFVHFVFIMYRYKFRNKTIHTCDKLLDFIKYPPGRSKSNEVWKTKHGYILWRQQLLFWYRMIYKGWGTVVPISWLPVFSSTNLKTEWRYFNNFPQNFLTSGSWNMNGSYICRFAVLSSATVGWHGNMIFAPFLVLCRYWV